MGDQRFTLECRGLSCGYRDHLVLSGIDFRCQAGEVIALLGTNGSGKTTLIRALAGMIPAMSGEVFVQEAPISKMHEKEIAQAMATVPQEETHRFPFTVREVVAMGRLARSQSFFDSQEDLAAANEAMELAECSELADRHATELSGGERQRVLIARALAQRTPALLLDEPTAHLDVGHQMSVARLFRKLAEQGKAIIVALHDLNLVTTISDRAILLRDGHLATDLDAEAMINSQTLDEAYGVTFHRFRGEDARLRLYAAS